MSARTGCLALAISVLFGGLALAQQGAPKKAAPQIAPKTAATQQQGFPVPPPEVLLVMIRSALVGLDHANRTGNYSVLREIGGPVLQQHSSGQLSTAFAGLRTNNVDLLPAAIATPQLTQQPAVSQDGLLQLVGYFPTQPRRIQFHIIYQPAAGQWRLAGLNVGLAEAPAPVAKADPNAPADAGRAKAQPQATAKAAPVAKK
jgi:hypothetical protein